MTDPRGFFADMPETGGLTEPLFFLAACAAINAACHLLFGIGLGGFVVLGLGQILGGFLGAALLVLVAQHLFDGRAGFEPTFRVVAYAAAPIVFLWVPRLGPLAWLYAAYLTVRGLERVQGFDTTRAVLTVLIGLIALWLTGVPVAAQLIR
jgi:hypothetical protein